MVSTVMFCPYTVVETLMSDLARLSYEAKIAVILKFAEED